jgi:hypothetical protein
VAGHPHAVEAPDAIEVEARDVTAVGALVSTAAEEQVVPSAGAVVGVPACFEAQDGTAVEARACSEAVRDEPAALVEAEAGSDASEVALAGAGSDGPEAVAGLVWSPAEPAGLVAVRACCQAVQAVFEVVQACCRDGPVEPAAVRAEPSAEPVWFVAGRVDRGELRVDRALFQAGQDVLVGSAVGYPADLGE